MAVQTNLFEDAIAETIELHRDMTTAYIGYARETITDRALPDVRDGLKPVQRRILFAMKELGLTHDKPHKKSARIVGEVLGKYHPHGDSSVYLAMVRMAQPWIMSAPLVDGQGNFGSIDGDSPAAMRYTEARLTAVADTTLQDLHMDTVSWIDNFDGSLQEPVVLPSVLPNLLINGADGIAVGMATKIPPHNLGEVCDAVNFVAGNWKRRDKITVDELMQYIPGPDFPTGGIAYRYRKEADETVIDTIRQAYVTGRGRVIMQARLSIEEIGGGKKNIIINELPYAVLKTTVIEKLAREIRDGRISGITDLRDESDYTGMRVVIELSRNADPDETLQDIMKYSQLRETFGIINLALVPGEDNHTRPEYLPLRDMLTLFIDHRLEVIERRSRFELEKRQARLHIVDGLLKALDILDEVIAAIRQSRTVDTARTNLMRKFGFTEIQATAILDMQLRRLAALERQRLVDERKELIARIKYLEGLLASQAKRLAVVIEETTELRQAYAIPRRTFILDAEESAAGQGTVTTQADLVLPDDPQMVILTPNGLERKEAKGYSYRVGDELSTRTPVGGGHLLHLRADPNDGVLLITSLGRAWKGGVGFIPESADFKDMGLGKDEAIIGVSIVKPNEYLVMVSQSGKIKRTKVEDLSLQERTWDVVFGLGKGDTLLMGTVLPEKAHIIFYTKEGQLLRIDGDSVNPQQTGSASGVAGVKVRDEDKLLGACGVPGDEKSLAEQQVVITSENGYMHRVPLSEFAEKGRGGMGVRALNATSTTGKVGGVVVGTEKYVDVFLEDGRRQRVSVDSVPVTSRDARGNRLVKDPDKKAVASTIML